ncbi:MAG: Ig-like domain-containing protein [Eubacteriales bacterium]|jgi:hypothetical protein
MASLEDLKNIINRRLRRVVMTDEQKAQIRGKAAQSQPSTPRRYYLYGFLSVAVACLAVVLLVSVGLPAWRNARPAATTASAGGTTAHAATTAAAGGAGTSTPGRPDGTTSGNSGIVQPLTVRAMAETSSGVSTNSAFLITGISADTLKTSLTVTPALKYTLSDTFDGVRVVPTQTLTLGTVYTFSVDDGTGSVRSWAFQTETSLSVISTLPGDSSTGADIRTGIEIVFSAPIRNADGYFTIFPAVPGHLEYSGRTLIYIPDAPLNEDTVYTVTLKSGLPSGDNLTLPEDYTFSFRTAIDYDSPNMYLLDRVTENYLPSDPVAVSVYASDSLDGAAFTVNVYPLTTDTYLDYARQAADETVSVIGRSGDVTFQVAGTPSMSVTTTLARPENSWWGTAYFVLPDTLPEGHYLLDILPTGDVPARCRVQKLVQVSPLAVYTESLGGDTVVWVNSSVTGKPVSGTDVTLGASSAKTDANGYAKLAASGTSAALRIKGDAFVDYLTLPINTTDTVPYYTVFYTDRAAYLPTDTLCFWGRLLPRTSGDALPGTLAMTLDNGSTLQTVTVASDGTFSGELSFKSLMSYSHRLSFHADGREIVGQNFTVLDYTKPSYVLKLTADRTYYRAGEPITLTAVGTFFDGTPAAGLEVTFHHAQDAYNTENSPMMTLDNNGRATYTYTPARKTGSWYPDSLYCGVETTGAEDVWVSAYLFVPYLRSDTMLTVENTSDTDLQLKIRSNAINFAKYDPESFSYGTDLDLLRGAAERLSGTYTVTRHSYVRVQVGETYDYINKVTVPQYEYNPVETVVYQNAFTTSGGAFVTPVLPLDYTDAGWYSCEVTAVAPDGANLREQLYLSSPYYPTSQTISYLLRRDSDDTFALGDTLTMRLYERTNAVRSGTMLISRYQNAITRTDILPAGTYSLTYTKELLPNVVLGGAYFDGTHIYSVDYTWLSYASRERELNVTVTPDRDSYTPGDTVRATVRITDRDGKPVSVPFALGVVDNAAFAVMEQYLDPLSDLYRDIYNNVPTRYVSYTDHADGLKHFAEGGGEGSGEGVRDNFKDTAAFLTGATDANGSAAVTFTLPDNLTSWRLTCVAVGSTPSAGIGKTSVSVSLPFFVNVVSNDEYLTGDDLAVSLRAMGAATVDYTVTLKCSARTLEQTASGAADKLTFVSFGQQPAGTYTLTVVARSQEGYMDGISKTVTVTDSRHQVLTVSHFNLADGVNLPSKRYPVTLLFYDKQQELFMQSFARMWVSHTTRLDGALADVVADRLLYSRNTSDTLSEFLDWSGGYKLFPYGEADAETTAWALAADAESLNRESAKTYLYSVLSNRDSAESEVYAAYMGLAALHEPVLREVQWLLNSAAPDKKLGSKEYLTLTAALALLGDSDGAENAYRVFTDTLTATKLTDDELFELNLYKLLIETCLHDSSAENTLRQIVDTESDKVSPTFAILAYLTRTPALAESTARFSYVFGGETVVLDFSEHFFHLLTLSENELAAANFRVMTGSIGVSAVWVSELHENNGGAKVSQSVTGDLTVGGRAALTLDVTLPANTDAVQLVSVVLPSGTRYTGVGESSWEEGWWVVDQEDGRVTLRLDSTKSTHFSMTLKLRCVLPGSFVCEPVVVTDTSDNTFSTGGRTSVTIR